MLRKQTCSSFLMAIIFIALFSVSVYADDAEDHFNEWMERFNPNTNSITEDSPGDNSNNEGTPVPYAELTEKEPNNKVSDAGTGSIKMNDTVTGYLNETEDIDCFLFTATKNTKIVITLDNIPVGYTHELWLQDSNGKALASSKSTEKVYQNITYNVTQGNTYRIVVYGRTKVLTTMQYKLSLTETSQNTTVLPVGWTKQQKSNWCWLACGEMVIKYEYPSFNKGTSSTRQERLCKLVRNNTTNETGSTSAVMEAAKSIVTDGTFDNVAFKSLTSSTKFDTNVKNKLTTSKQPVLINFYNLKPPYNDSNSPSYGHSCVIYGYDSSGKYYFYDPYYTYASTTNKITHSVTQSAILNGFSLTTWSSFTWYGGTVIVY